MLELLNDNVLWWHWIIVGLALLVAEMITGTFVLLGLGIAAILVGAIALLSDVSFNTELLLWLVFSVVAMGIWFKWFRAKPVTQSGQSNYRLDTLGTVKEEIAPHHRGKVVFDTPVLGNASWYATARMRIPEGARVKIVQISGQLIEVKQI